MSLPYLDQNLSIGVNCVVRVTAKPIFGVLCVILRVATILSR